MPHKADPSKESPAPAVFAKEIEGFTAQAKLSRREIDIVVSLVRNITNSEDIARSLGISTHTVNNHLKSIFEKTSTKSKTEILSAFLRFAAERLQGRNLFVRRPRVLIIDDEPVIAEVIASGLSERGLKTYTLSNPDQAVEMIGKFNVDFVVCDVRMPPQTGMDVLKAVRAAFKCWPYFVFITGFPDVTLEECMHHGAIGFVDKPVDIDKLFRLIVGHLVDSGEERMAILQVDAGEPVILDAPCEVGEKELGFGGAFLALDNGLQKKNRLGIGTVVDVVLAPTQSPTTLKIRGQVVWKRVAKEDSLRPGIGVKFLGMSDRDQSIFDELLRSSETTSFIPLGGSA